MKHRYLEVTFRNGKPVAAYFYLPRNPGDTSTRTERRDGGLLIDYSIDGRPIGIEITAPAHLSLDALNQVLTSLHFQPAARQEVAPLAAA